jgi:hypothetical protein
MHLASHVSSYITRPLLINRRKFGLRLWALVPGSAPLRAYIHTNGLALFSSEPYRPEGEPPIAATVDYSAGGATGSLQATIAPIRASKSSRQTFFFSPQTTNTTALPRPLQTPARHPPRASRPAT